MPATETTWRDVKLMHVVFAVSSVAMLVTTVWMLADDHNRSWKQFQRQFRDIETWTAAARIDEQQTSDYELTDQQLKAQLQAVQQAALSDEGRQLFAQFVAEAKQTDQQEDIDAAGFIAQDVERLAGYTDAAARRDLRMDLYNRLRDLIQRVRFREDNLARNVKFEKARLDAALATYGIAVGKGDPEKKIAQLQLQIDNEQSDVAQLTVLLQKVQTHRKELDGIFKQITAAEDQARKALEDHQNSVLQLAKARDERAPNLLKSLVEMPIVDAFNSPLKIDQIWLPNLTLYNNFRDVARFDRCATCHQAIDKTQPGAPTVPAYEHAGTKTIALATPSEPPQPQRDAEGEEVPVNLQQVYGFSLADRGQVRSGDVTVVAVYPNSPAAKAGLASGDVLVRVNDAAVLDMDRALDNLLVNVKWGQPLELTVRRGLPHPFSSHPRLDLFVGSFSPHPMGKFGCTICHQGQGSATSFEWASHTPSSPRQAVQWQRDYGWFHNHNWLFNMYPKQFLQASCLTCHHDVVDLEPSAKHPDPPAPQLVKGYELVREYGCFGCHEINGWSGPQKRVGPDLRTEPAFSAAAAAIKADQGFAHLSEDAKKWVERVMHHPEDSAARRRLQEFVASDAQAETPLLTAASHRLEGTLKDVEVPGTMRKVGPSLRHVASKVGFEWLFGWVRNPRDFRPSTKMPRFFGQWDHLVPEEQLDEHGKPVLDEHGRPVLVKSKGLLVAERLEPVEIRAVANYLLRSSEKFDYVEPYSGITEEPSAQRGKKAFETRGCLACHQHQDFPQAKATQGPNLTGMGAKLGLKPLGARWLYSWLRDPSHYHARTVMPNVMLTPLTLADRKVIDPAADITAYLMQSTEVLGPNDDWRKNVPEENQMTAAEHEALYDLGLEYLKEKFPIERAKQYLKEGIPVTRAVGLVGDEGLLVREGPATSDAEQTQRVLLYVGRRTIGKAGCAGCHDIPGYEDAKPIGTTLADWGRKDPSRMAFEQISEYVTHYAWPGKSSGGAAHDAGAHAHAAPANLAFAIEDLGPTKGWLMEKLLGHEREGFLWQKLREPRSFDFKKTENKGYTERLRMPRFNFDEEQIEAVMTFVLGLVSEPPAAQYIADYKDDPRERAIIAGTKVIEQFNCGGCHQLDFERWDVAFHAGQLGSLPPVQDYPFLLPHFTAGEIEQSKKTDRRGLLHAQIYGRPAVNPQGEPVTTDENEEGDPYEGGGLATQFVLWKDVLLNGQAWLVGGKNPLVPERSVVTRYSGRGGDLGQWIYPAVVADELAINPNAKATEAWGWLPPPLIGQGNKTQTKWLHDFLLDPYPIRPAVVLRMPKFNMSSPEASALVEYFAARDNAPSPYEFDPRTSTDYLTAAELGHPNRLGDALKIVTNNSFCVQCHSLGDYAPPGNPRTLGPQLDRVSQRLRPDWVHRWTGNPKRILPYTGMPTNIPYDKPVAQTLFPGTSTQQLDGVVDLLMNWDRFAKAQFTVKPLVLPATGSGAQPPTGSE